jgi:hypothetical protein
VIWCMSIVMLFIDVLIILRRYRLEFRLSQEPGPHRAGWIRATRIPNGAASGRSASFGNSTAYLVMAYEQPVGDVTRSAAGHR